VKRIIFLVSILAILVLNTNCLAFWPIGNPAPDYETDRLEMYVEYSNGDWGMTPDMNYKINIYSKEGLECKGKAIVRFLFDWDCPEEFLEHNRKFPKPYCTPSSNFNNGFTILVYPKVGQSTGWQKFNLDTYHYGAQNVEIMKVEFFEAENLQCKSVINEDKKLEEECWDRCLKETGRIYEEQGMEKSTEFYNTDPMCQCE
jgi:hypothetical protein